MKHHVRGVKRPAELRDVVPPDEGIRISGPWSTTSAAPKARTGSGTWCLPTKKYGFAGHEAPRPRRRRPGWTQGRGASRRRNKDFRAMKHHVHGAKGPAELRDVVPPDEGIRISGP